jgi:hypothetical protein
MPKRAAAALLLGGWFLAGMLAGCTPATVTPNLTPSLPQTAEIPPTQSVSQTPAALTETLTPASGEELTPTGLPTSLPAASQTPLPKGSGSATPTPDPATILEMFDGSYDAWQVIPEVSGSGSVVRTSDQFHEGMASARLDITGEGGTSFLKAAFREAALEHTWGERPGTWSWFRAYVFVPSSSLAQLGADGYLTVGGVYASGAGYGWYLRLHENGALYVVGQRDWDNTPIEFRVYGSFPQDRWVQVELGLHSQAGPGVKRAFAFLIDGDFYGWYRQGRMKEEVYDTAALGILSTSASQPITIYVDDWFRPTQDPFPSGSDNRSSAAWQEQDFTLQDGRQWQIDWTSWENNLTLDPKAGLYSPTARFQAGRNLDRMPSLESGWAEIEYDWPQGPPPTDESLSEWYDGLIAFRKEINREENLEAGFYVNDGQAVVYYCAWVGECIMFAEWPLPLAETLGDGRNLPEPGDLLRVRWEQVTEAEIHVQTSFYDASADTWYLDVIDDTHDLTSLPDVDPPGETINFMDGYHLASAITADTPYFSIRRYRVGTLETYPEP